MEHFEIPVTWKNAEYSFPAELHMYGYSYKIKVDVWEEAFFFERDEERQWRVVTMPDAGESKKVDKGLLREIVQVLDQLLT